MLIVLAGVGAISLIDGVIRPPYAVKSGVKILLFGLLPALYGRYGDRELKLAELFRLGGKKRALAEALLWGAGIFGVILGGYCLLGRWFDFTGITANLESAMGIRRDNFLLVATDSRASA